MGFVIVLAAFLGGCAEVPVVDEADLAKASDGSPQIRVIWRPWTAVRQAIRGRVVPPGRAGAGCQRAGARTLPSSRWLRTARFSPATGSVSCATAPRPSRPCSRPSAGRHATSISEYYIFEDVTCEESHLGDLLVRRSQAGVPYPRHLRRYRLDRYRLGVFRQARGRRRPGGVQPPIPGGITRRSMPGHTSLLVADGTVAILGGVDLGTTCQSAPSLTGDGRRLLRTGALADVWHDTDIEINGPDAIAGAGDVVRTALERAGRCCAPRTDPRPPRNRPATRSFAFWGNSPVRLKRRYYVPAISTIRNAESSIWITGAYFVPTHQEKEGLIKRRAVESMFVCCSRHAATPARLLAVQHSHYDELLRAGVKVYVARRRHPALQDPLVISQVWSIVGSSTSTIAVCCSMTKLDAVVAGPGNRPTAGRGFHGRPATRARRSSLARWRQRSAARAHARNVWRLLEPLL